MAENGLALHEAALAFAAGIARASGHNHTELSGNDVQPLAHIFADDVTLMSTGAGGAVWCDDLFNTWQMFG